MRSFYWDTGIYAVVNIVVYIVVVNVDIVVVDNLVWILLLLLLKILLLMVLLLMLLWMLLLMLLRCSSDCAKIRILKKCDWVSEWLSEWPPSWSKKVLWSCRKFCHMKFRWTYFFPIWKKNAEKILSGKKSNFKFQNRGYFGKKNSPQIFWNFGHY